MKESSTFISAEGREWELFGPGLYRQILGYNGDIMSVRVRFDEGGIVIESFSPMRADFLPAED